MVRRLALAIFSLSILHTIADGQDRPDADGSTFKFPPVQVGRYFDEDSKKAKDDVINEFVKELLARKKAVGRVIVNAAEKDPAWLVERRTGRLLDALKKKGKRCLKLVIDRGHRGGLSGASFWVVHESFMKGRTVTIVCPQSSPRHELSRRPL